LKAGTVVGATLIAAPSSTKNQSGERYPEMHQRENCNQEWLWIAQPSAVQLLWMSETAWRRRLRSMVAQSNAISNPEIRPNILFRGKRLKSATVWGQTILH